MVEISDKVLNFSEQELEQILSLPVKIDGSMLEGGGQLFRMSIALSYLLRRSV